MYLLEVANRPDIFSQGDFDKAARLANYAVEIRYPNNTLQLGAADIDDALEIATFFSEKIRLLLQ